MPLIRAVEVLQVDLPPKVLRTDAIPPEAPGLGIDWDWQALERRAVTRAQVGA